MNLRGSRRIAGLDQLYAVVGLIAKEYPVRGNLCVLNAERDTRFREADNFPIRNGNRDGPGIYLAQAPVPDAVPRARISSPARLRG